MTRRTRTLILALMLPPMSLLAGCEDEGPAEEAGEQIDEAAEDIGDAAEEAGDRIEDATDQ